jgi:1,4-alpha-glucan branching enzyme
VLKGIFIFRLRIVLGYFTFILHTHLPYVLHHGKWPFGSDWLCEAAAESYIPLLEAFDNLSSRNLRVRISMDFSPVNLEQLSDPRFIDIFTAYCDEKILAAENDYKYFATNAEPQLQPLAEHWRAYYQNARDRFVNKYHGNLVTGFRKLFERGVLDPMTCGATHGYFPLLLKDQNIRAQIRVAIDTHEKHFGKRPRGIWLPECAYRPAYNWQPPVGPEEIRSRHYDRKGIEELLAENKLEYFVVDGHQVTGGKTMHRYHPFFESQEFLNEQAPLPIPGHEPHKRSLASLYQVCSTERDILGKLPVIFARDPQTAAQVWSTDIGYPGSPPYLDFHKKHHNSGLRYWAVTGAKVDLDKKVQYDPSLIEAQIAQNAMHFVEVLRARLREHALTSRNPGIVSSPFDTELFGHWWHEGPRFVARVMELLDKDPDVLLTDCREAVDNPNLKRPTIALPEGSWGDGGGHAVWLNNAVDWMWDILYPLEDRFLELVAAIKKRALLTGEAKPGLLHEVFQQTGRELLLLESSDWEFLISTKGAVQYATDRFNVHATNLEKLLGMCDCLIAGQELGEDERHFFTELVAIDAIFPDITLEAWA